MAKLDQALEYQQLELEQRLAQHQSRPIIQANDIVQCVDCGDDIGAERKKALPHAMRCVGCQWQWERTHERGGQ